MLTDFDSHYSTILRTVTLRSPGDDNRTGAQRRQMHGVSMHMRGLPLLTLRDCRPLWACAEAVWFLSGSNEASFMESFGFKNWSKFAKDGHVNSAMGHRWQSYGTRQLDRVRAMLRQDPTAQRAVLDAWVPKIDLQLAAAKRRLPNAPCLPFWHFTIIMDRLHLTVMQRSCDLYFGLPADMAVASIIQHLMAADLGYDCGDIHWCISNAHVYGDAQDACLEMIKRADEVRTNGGGSSPNFALKVEEDWMERAMEGDKAVVWDVYHRFSGAYDRVKRPAIQGPRLVV